MGWVVNATCWLLYYMKKDPAPIIQEAEWSPGPVWTGTENLAPHQDLISGPFIP